MTGAQKLAGRLSTLERRLKRLEIREVTPWADRNMFHPMTYRAVGDGTTDDRDILNDVVNNQVPAAGGYTIIDRPYRIASALTVPVKATLRFVRGGMISIDNGITLTIDGPLEAEMYQIFDGDGDVSFGDGSVREIYCHWFGLVGDGAADDGPAINKALDSADGVNNVYLAEGDYAINETLNVTGQMAFRGAWQAGSAQTLITALSAITMILMDKRSQVANLHLEGGGLTNPASRGIVIGTPTSTNNRVEIRRVYLGDGLYYGIYSGYAVDLFLFEECSSQQRVGMASVYLERLAGSGSNSGIIRRLAVSAPHNSAAGLNRFGVYISGGGSYRIENSNITERDTCIKISDSAAATVTCTIQTIHTEERRDIITGATRWAAVTGYLLGDIVKPTAPNATGFVYEAQNNGNSGGAEPAWPTTYGGTVVDGGVTWEAVAKSVFLEVEGGFREITLQDIDNDGHIVLWYVNGHGWAEATSWHQDQYRPTDWCILAKQDGSMGGHSYFKLTNCRWGAIPANLVGFASNYISIFSIFSSMDHYAIKDNMLSSYLAPKCLPFHRIRVTADYTVDEFDYGLVECDTSGGAIVVTLPDAVEDGRMVIIYRNGGNQVSVTTLRGFEGVASPYILAADGNSITVVSRLTRPWVCISTQ